MLHGQTMGDYSVEVCVADSEHVAGIAAIYNYHIDAGGATFDTDHWKPELVQRLIRGPHPEAWFVALDRSERGESTSEDEIIGWASAKRHSLRHGYRFTCETAIYLAENAIGRGVAQALQDRVEEHCRQAGIHHAIAKVIADNQRSIAFHQRYGYQIVGIQKEVGHMDGKWCDVAILQKIFD